MRRVLLILSGLLCFVTVPALAGVYDRNTARPVNQVVFGKLESVRNISHQQVLAPEPSGWKTLGGAVLGGLAGNQFGGGHGREIATAVGALAGAAATHYYQSNAAGETVTYRQLELLIRSEAGELIQVVQDADPAMVLSVGEPVRLLYFDDGVRVDRAY